MVSRRTYYELLGLPRTATPAEIDQARRDRRKLDAFRYDSSEIDRAHSVLSDPIMKRLYDVSLGRPEPPASTERKPAPDGKTMRSGRAPAGLPHRIPLQIGLVAALAAVLVLSVWPMVGWRLQSYPIGTELVLRNGGGRYGTILGYDRHHPFAAGPTLPAYQVRLHADAEQRWLTRDEVNQLARPARRSDADRERSHD